MNEPWVHCGERVGAHARAAILMSAKMCEPGLEEQVAYTRALDEAGIRTKADLIFVFTVEEETSFGGVKHFIAENKDRIGQYVEVGADQLLAVERDAAAAARGGRHRRDRQRRRRRRSVAWRRARPFRRPRSAITKEG